VTRKDNLIYGSRALFNSLNLLLEQSKNFYILPVQRYEPLYGQSASSNLLQFMLSDGECDQQSHERAAERNDCITSQP
jgi:hypothetical protein